MFGQKALNTLCRRRTHFPVPDTIEFAPIDRQNGLLPVEDSKEAYYVVFAPGSAPTRLSTEQQLKARDFFRMDL